jgi:hypothetical protein
MSPKTTRRRRVFSFAGKWRWRAALGDAPASPRELGPNPPFGSEEQVNAYVMALLKALSQ